MQVFRITYTTEYLTKQTNKQTTNWNIKYLNFKKAHNMTAYASE